MTSGSEHARSLVAVRVTRREASHDGTSRVRTVDAGLYPLAAARQLQEALQGRRGGHQIRIEWDRTGRDHPISQVQADTPSPAGPSRDALSSALTRRRPGRSRPGSHPVLLGLVAMLVVVVASSPARPSRADTTAVTLFSSSVPKAGADPDPHSVELGLRFQASVAGVVEGVRFYKNDTNTGPHVGNLWTSRGEHLATVTFTGEHADETQEDGDGACGSFRRGLRVPSR